MQLTAMPVVMVRRLLTVHGGRVGSDTRPSAKVLLQLHVVLEGATEWKTEQAD